MMNLSLLLERFARFPLVEGPTPLQRLPRLEQALGGRVRLYAKRDDLMGLGLGGNKLRKLEFLIGQALEQGCDTFITTGGLQSNHARLSAAAAAKAGLACELVLASMVAQDDPAYAGNGNLVLDELFGARIHRVAGDVDALAVARQRAQALAEQGRKAYVVGLGGSSPVGSLGYVACAAELRQQEEALGLRFSHIVVPSGSVGTHAGLALGLHMLGDTPARIQAYSVLAGAPEALRRTEDLVEAMRGLLGVAAPVPERALRVDGSQLGAGYGLPTPAMVEALRLMARTEGLVLDPVYSGKAFAGLVDAVRSGRVEDGAAVLFVMTGGAPGLFAYPRTLLPS
ncbi:MAG: D-cysteine desulfhydrase family protein [Burkholderiaceae bacterium]|jgi:D-cysteine desulfhydrase|nr:D-cysteine desulfhydrase family protein [Burkholderiaceae bacterium]